MKYEDPLIDEDLHGNANLSSENPLKTAAKLLVALALALALGYFVLSLLIFQVVRFIPFETEQKWFKPLTEATLAQFSDAASASDRAKATELQRIADKLVGQTLAKDPDHPLSKITITVHYSDDEMINAFAMPGGHIVVMRGLIEALPNENVLAMVIAHEIAHVIHRDSLKNLGRQVLTNIVLYSLFGGDSAGLMNQGMALLSTKYSRGDETNADTTGLLSATHPLPLDRKQQLADQIEKRGYQVNFEDITPLGEALRHDKTEE